MVQQLGPQISLEGQQPQQSVGKSSEPRENTAPVNDRFEEMVARKKRDAESVERKSEGKNPPAKLDDSSRVKSEESRNKLPGKTVSTENLKEKLLSAAEKIADGKLIVKTGTSNPKKGIPLKGLAEEAKLSRITLMMRESRKEARFLAAGKHPEKELVVKKEKNKSFDRSVSERIHPAQDSSTRLDLQKMADAVRSQALENGELKESQKSRKEHQIKTLVITLEDHRTSLEQPDRIQTTLSQGKNSGQGNQKGLHEKAGQDDVKGVTLENQSSRETLFMIKENDFAPEGSGSRFQPPVSREAGASLFDQYMKAQGSREMARNIHFVMKDQNAGEIKLILKPESLGRVRIKLNFSENNITGRILVENNSVKQIFQENLHQIIKALEEQGYGTAKLDVSVDQQDSQGNPSSDGKEKNPFFSSRTEMLRNMDSHIPLSSGYGRGTGQLNLIA